MRVANASITTYGTRLRAKLDPTHPCNKSFGQPGRAKPSDETVEREFQQKLAAGWNTKRSNRCNSCFQVRTATGTCGCE